MKRILLMLFVSLKVLLAGANDNVGFYSNMPVGIDGNFGNYYYKLSIDSMEIVRGKDTKSETDDYTSAVANVAISLPFLPMQEDSSNMIRLGGKIALKSGDTEQRNRIYLSSNEFRLPIIKDKVYLNLVGKNSSLSRRRMGQCAHPSEEGTYVEFDCNGLTDIQLTGYFDFADYLVAMERNNSVDGKKSVWSEKVGDDNVYVPFEIRGKGGISSRLCFSSPFAVRGVAKNFVFEVKDAVFDLSNEHNADGFELPYGYWNDALPEEAWIGLFLREMNVYFPEDFRLNDGGDLTTASISNMFIDDYGFTGLAAVDSIVNKDVGSSGVNLDIDRIAVEFFQNEFIRGEMDGRVSVPFLTARDKGRGCFYSNAEFERYNDAKEVMTLGFGASVNYNLHDEKYTFFARANAADIAKDYDVPFTDNAYITVAPGTGISITNDPSLTDASDRLKFTLNMNGALTLESSKYTLMSNDEDAVSKFGFDAELKGISFEGLRFSNLGVPVTIDNFAIDGETDFRFMGMTLTLKELAWNASSDYYLSYSTEHGALNVSAKIQFMNEANSLSAESRFAVKLSFNAGDGNSASPFLSPNSKWNFDGIDIGRIALRGDFSVFAFDGYLDVYKDDPLFGKGFRGSLDMSLVPLGLKIGTQACFGSTLPTKTTESFNYWFAKATADMCRMKTPILLFPPNVYLASITGGAYNHMNDGVHDIRDDKARGPIETFRLADVSNYKPDINSGLGFIAGIGAYLGSETLATAKTELNVSLTPRGALREIRLGGLVTMIETNPMEFIPLESNANQKLMEINQKLSKKVGDVVPKYLTKLSQVNELTKTMEESGNKLKFTKESKFEGTISGWMNAYYVPSEKLFNLDARVNVDLYGMVRGNANLSFHSDPNRWYCRLGTNSDPCYLNFVGGSVISKTYFMVGELPSYNIPPISPVAARELNRENADYNSETQSLASAKGMAFAADMNMNVDAELIKIAYFSSTFGGGTDLLVSDRQYCHDGKLHNWRGGGDVYGYFNMSTGLRFSGKKFPIFKGNMFMGLNGEAPAPVNGSGKIKFQCSILFFNIPELNIKVSVGKRIDNKCD